MIIYEGKFPIGTFVKHKISKYIYIVRSITMKDNNGKNAIYTLSNGVLVIDVIENEIEIATAKEVEEASQIEEVE